MQTSRRRVLEGTVASLASTALAKPAFAQAFPFTPNQRYPDPALIILDPGFLKYRIYSSTLERLARACAGPRARCISPMGSTCW
jgi:gluconolactonase